MINLPEKNSTQVNSVCWTLLMRLRFMLSNSVSCSLWAVDLHHSRQCRFNTLVHYLFSVGFLLLKSRTFLGGKKVTWNWVNVSPLCMKKIVWILGILRYSCFHRVRQSCIIMGLSGTVKTAEEIQSERREGSFSAFSDNEVDGCTESSQEVNDEVLHNS